MNCPACSFENRDDATFYGDCGQSLAIEVNCGSCGQGEPNRA